MKDNYLDSLSEEEKFALLFGIIAGDGCLSFYITKDRKQKKVIVVTGNFYDDKEFFETILVPLLKSFTNNSVKIKDKRYCGTIEIHVFDKELFQKIEELEFPIGKKGPKLFIPKYFYEKDLLRNIVQGFFATDGSLVLTKNPNKFYPRVEGNGISKNLIRQIAEYLNHIGMNGYFYITKRKNETSGGGKQQQYRFQFNGRNNLILFNNLVGFVNPKHKKKFNEFIKYDEQYDKTIFGLPPIKQKSAGEPITSEFKKKWLWRDFNPRPLPHESSATKH